MNAKSPASANFSLLTFALTFYCLGASYVEGFVNYRTWPLVGAAEFVAYHKALSPRIIATLVVPVALQLLMSVLLLWFRPPAIPRWAVIPPIVCGVVNWASTIFVQIPIQAELNSGKSLELIERLIVTDWLRKITLTTSDLWFLWLMAKLLRRALFQPGNGPVVTEEK
jgi:hypothetical protein